jgi:hypothetical protein
MTQPAPELSLTERIAELRAECERRLAVCEAQPAGPYLLLHAMPGQDQDVGIKSPSHAGVIAECFEERDKNIRSPEAAYALATAIAAQRTERPQELRTLIDILRLANEAMLIKSSDVGLLVANRAIATRIVEIAERSLGKDAV